MIKRMNTSATKGTSVNPDRLVVDYNPEICEVNNDVATLYSPFDFMEGNNLYLPEGIRMPDGHIITKVRYEIEVPLRVEWEGGPITLYAGRNYLDAVNEFYHQEHKQLIMQYRLYYPYVANIVLYEEGVYNYTTKNGILYHNDKILYVPECNEYAEKAPLEPLTGTYSEELSSTILKENDCKKDLFGGVYSSDGKKFIRWSGSRYVSYYKVRDGVEEIGDSAFWVVTGIGNGDHGLGCLKTLVLPQSLKKIGKEALRACLFTKIDIPNGVEVIDDEAFASCQCLRSVTLPPTLKIVGEGAFRGCSFESIHIPKSVECLGHLCFQYCWKLTSIEVEKDNESYSSESGVLYNKDKTTLIKVPQLLYPDSPDNVNIVEKSDDDSDFPKKDTRKGFAVPQGVTRIEDDAFRNCSLSVITIPSSVSFIGKEALRSKSIVCLNISADNRNYRVENDMLIDTVSKRTMECYSKDKCVIPDGVETIGVETFSWSDCKSVVIPEGVTSILDCAFWISSIDYLQLPSTICYISPNAFSCFFDSHMGEWNKTIEVPEGLKNKYLRLIGEDDSYYKRLSVKEVMRGDTKERKIGFARKSLGIVSEEDLKDAVADEYNALYSKDGKRLLRFPGSDDESGISSMDYYRVKDGTEIICSDSANRFIRLLYIPASVKYIGANSVEYSVIMIFACKDVTIEKDFRVLTLDDTVYIPAGTWADYYSKIDQSRIREEEETDEEDDSQFSYRNDPDYRLVELSRANVRQNLEWQKDLLIKAITQTTCMESYHIDSLNGDKRRGFYCYRTNDRAFFFDEVFGMTHIWVNYLSCILSALGCTRKDLADTFGVQIDLISNNSDTLRSVIGKKIAENVVWTWDEDFVDEETGDVVTIPRSDIIMYMGNEITEENIEDIVKSKKEYVRVFHDYYQQYCDDVIFGLFKYFSDPEEKDWKYLYLDIIDDDECYQKAIRDLFPSKRYEEITEEDKADLAYNILQILNKAIEHQWYLKEYMILLRKKPQTAHNEVNNEEMQLLRFVSEFYNKRIDAVNECKTDFEVMAVFSEPRKLQEELKEYLDSKNVLDVYLSLGIDMLFDYYFNEENQF